MLGGLVLDDVGIDGLWGTSGFVLSMEFVEGGVSPAIVHVVVVGIIDEVEFGCIPEFGGWVNELT